MAQVCARALAAAHSSTGNVNSGGEKTDDFCGTPMLLPGAVHQIDRSRDDLRLGAAGLES